MSDLDRFKAAQSQDFETAIAELRQGRKTSHWIWYIFPQIAGLGRSGIAQQYALADLDEVRAYLADPELRDHLLRAADVVRIQLQSGAPLPTLMGGGIDSLKLVSSLTLFEIASSDRDAEIRDVCTQVLDLATTQGYPRCSFTRSACENS